MMHQCTECPYRTHFKFKSTVDERLPISAACLHKIVKPARTVSFRKLSDVIQKGTHPLTKWNRNHLSSVIQELHSSINDNGVLFSVSTERWRQHDEAIETREACHSHCFRVHDKVSRWYPASFVGIAGAISSRIGNLLVQSSDLSVHFGLFFNLRRH